MPTDVPSNAPSAFFSYCRADSDFALKLAEDLKAAGANVWIDQLDIEPGAPWDAAVEEALNKSPRMLVILSPVSVTSDNVRDEVSFALSRQKRVIPVLYRDCEVPFRLARLQHIDFRNDHDRGLKLLLKSLGVVTPPPAAQVDEAAERAKTEQAELDRKAAEEKARQEEIQRKLLATEQEQLEARKRDSVAEWLRLEQGRQRLAAEQAKLEEDRKQTAAEKARLEQLERDRKAAEEEARLEQAERERQAAAGQARRDEAERQRVASEKIPPQPATPLYQETPALIPAKFPTWGKIAAGVGAAVIVIWLLYAVLSPKKQPNSESQAPETQAQQTQPANQPPASQPQSPSVTSSTPSSSEPATITPEKGTPKDQTPSLATAPKQASTDASRGLTPRPAPSTETTAASIPPGLSPDVSQKYRKAQSGDARAMAEVGYAYSTGEGAPKDPAQAFFWDRKAAEASNLSGMLYLAIDYRDGIGTKQDDLQAVTWFRKAADGGNADAVNGLGRMYEQGRGGLSQDYNQALACYRKAADAGDAAAMNNLGRMYQMGWGVQQDKQQAISWYRKAAQLGNQAAIDNLKRLGENP